MLSTGKKKIWKGSNRRKSENGKIYFGRGGSAAEVIRGGPSEAAFRWTEW